MKIVEIRIEKVYGHGIVRPAVPGAERAPEPEPIEQAFLHVLTDEGPSGIYGPISPAPAIKREIEPRLKGCDPLAGEALWQRVYRDCFRFGHKNREFLSALSAVDCALWDIRGKHYGVPVYRLLGGPTRDRIPAYASALGFSADPNVAGRQAQWLQSLGYTAQKWFFTKSPRWHCGRADMLKDLARMRALRGAVGDDDELMFDAVMTWDLEYALAMARKMADVDPKWLEEPLPSTQLDGFVRLKKETSVPLAAGEHLYTRWQVKPYLDAGVLGFVQCDPAWTGGITELTKICALAAVHGVKVCPHGHHIISAVHVIASQPEWVCPLLEYLVHHGARVQFFYKDPLVPAGGHIELPRAPGLGIELDTAKIQRREELS